METLFKKIGSSKTLSQEIVENIEKHIVSKNLVPGQKLPTEKELCEMFGVSRTALREALQMLSARELISIKKGSGIYVNELSTRMATKSMRFFLEMNFDKEYILHVIKVRKMFEPELARLAALNRKDEDIDYLHENIEKLSQAKDVKYEGELDRDFHIKIAEASGNPIIPLMVNPIFRLMPKIRTIVYAKIDSAKSAALTSHKVICKNLENKDSNGAFESMLEHIIIAEKHSLEIFEAIKIKEN